MQQLSFVLVFLFLNVNHFSGIPHQLNWENFKKLYQKQYKNVSEELKREQIFQAKLQKVQEHNNRFKKQLESYEIEINQFSDLTETEIFSYETATTCSSKTGKLKYPKIRLPDNFDWRDRNVITGVKNQAECGSCWAFATTGSIEAHYKMRTNLTVNLSEQQLLDCVPESKGCGGGWMTDGYFYIAQNGGLNYNVDYPYEAIKKSCRFQSAKAKVEITGYEFYEALDEESLKFLVVSEGPVSVVFDGRGTFVDYKRGVYFNRSCSKHIFTHAGIIIGYGTENGRDFWWLKNSWGSDWGLSGYVKIARQQNHCGIASRVSYPILHN